MTAVKLARSARRASHDGAAPYLVAIMTGPQLAGLVFLEEPIRDESPEAYESLRTMTDVPFAIDEERATREEFQIRHQPQLRRRDGSITNS
jgi:hypothetical protein